MANVFLSYAAEDRVRVWAVAEALSRSGWTVWWDRTIPPGSTFDEVIEEALARAQCVVVLWSKASVASHWVKAEAAEGAERQILVPVLLDAVKIPLEFRRLQAADLTAWQGDRGDREFQKFLKSISSVAPITLVGAPAPRRPVPAPAPVPLAFDQFKPTPVPEVAPQRRSPPRASNARWGWAALALMIGLAAGVVWTKVRPSHEELQPRPAAAASVGRSDDVDRPVASVDPRLAVPSVLGKSVEDATARLEEAGLAVGTTTLRDAGAREVAGLVVAQRPAEGERVVRGTQVDLSIARAPMARPAATPREPGERGQMGAGEPAIVPSLQGLSLADARDRLARRRLAVGTLDTKVSEFTENTVLAQDPPSGSRLPPGSMVSLVVAAP
jgi:hypothetical protein